MMVFIEKPRAMALVGFLMCIPATVALLLLSLGIQPDFGPLEHLVVTSDPGVPNAGVSLLVFVLILLLPLGGFLNARHVIRAIRSGAGALSLPANLVVAIYSLAFTAMVVSGIIVAQYFCWSGVPKCD